MTIASFCREQLLSHGPLSLDLLGELARAAGVTAARDPALAVRGAISYQEVELTDGRWASPLWLLEGRCLTTRCRRPDDGQPWDHDGSGYDDYCGDDYCGDDGGSGDSEPMWRVINGYDLAPLSYALRGGSMPLAAGGELRRNRYGHELSMPEGWLDATDDHELVAVRIRDRQVHVEPIADTAAVRARGQALADGLSGSEVRLPAWRHRPLDTFDVRLWNALARDPGLLTEPAAPLTECIPELAQELDRRRELANRPLRWQPQLDLAPELRRIAIHGALAGDQLTDEWLNAFVSRSLRSFSDETFEDAQVLEFRR